jgi:hypothetical protein
MQGSVRSPPSKAGSESFFGFPVIVDVGSAAVLGLAQALGRGDALSPLNSARMQWHKRGSMRVSPRAVPPRRDRSNGCAKPRSSCWIWATRPAVSASLAHATATIRRPEDRWPGNAGGLRQCLHARRSMAPHHERHHGSTLHRPGRMGSRNSAVGGAPTRSFGSGRPEHGLAPPQRGANGGAGTISLDAVITYW